ncbi:NlpC/P60 family protein [uncultured Christiangramia sp.]|uniref:C40 family peptidase n=1 Tax=uncultured Christiangramia sp. TaxID=503836 RepID=UPI0025F016F8|nr:NlpC/P60 family protein [uncultured Christiangramia sp.]|tara:strand:+ start:1016 stop:2221 length:1206 start_codon:yes stop_codon:yes gene_type:complete
MKTRSIIYFLTAILFLSCGESNKESAKNSQVEEIVEQTRTEFAPDKRVALFYISAEEDKNGIILKGETNSEEAKNRLLSDLDSAGVNYKDSIQVLPSEALGEELYGIIDVSVANLRGDSKHSSELVTQATLGTPVKIWKRTDEWYYIQTPDDYLSWVDHGGITTMNESDFNNWKTSEKIIITKAYGSSYAKPDLDSNPVTDLVTGAVLELLEDSRDFFKVRYPDAREAYVSKNDAKNYVEWLQNLEPDGESLTRVSEKLMGLPYLWGGTSAKGVDCSGFTKTIYFMNGMVIPRDASQQVKEGTLIDEQSDFSKLEVGDLLFFGRPATDSTSEKVVHVGMWIGNNEFIHSSGDVHISSVDDKAENFDEFNKSRYLRTKRYLDQQSSGLKYLKDQDFYNGNAK